MGGGGVVGGAQLFASLRMDRLALSHAALPHMMATLVEDTSTHALQLLTSGTVDLVCTR